MTVTTARPAKTCAEHPYGCGPEAAHRVSFRVRGNTPDDIKALTARQRPPSNVTDFFVDAAEARLGRVRCRTCHDAIPLTFGDLTGKPLDWWISEAVRIATGQRCDAHTPVVLGAGTPSAVSSRSGTGRKPATRKGGSAGRTEPPEAPAKFLAPVPHATPVKRKP